MLPQIFLCLCYYFYSIKTHPKSEKVMRNTHLKFSVALTNFQTPTGKAQREEGGPAKESGKGWPVHVKGGKQRLAEGEAASQICPSGVKPKD